MKHIKGLKCPVCSHEWPGHAVVGASYEYCPRCWGQIGAENDPLFHRIPTGKEYAGSVTIAGCDIHAAPMPCQYCQEVAPIARLQALYGAYTTARPDSYTARANTYAVVEVPAVKGRGSRVIGWGHDASRSDAYHAAWRDAVEWAEKHGWPAVLPEQ